MLLKLNFLNRERLLNKEGTGIRIKAKAKERKKAKKPNRKLKSEHELEDTVEAIVEFFQNNKSNLDVS